MLAPPTWAEDVARQRLVGAARALWVNPDPELALAARGRIGAHVARGLEILSEELFAEEADRAAIEQCRTRAQARPALGFLYRLPQSAGFGAAVGRAFYAAVAHDTRQGVEMAERVSALLGAYMTVIDGLVDHLMLPDATLQGLGAELFAQAEGLDGAEPPEPPGDADAAALVTLARKVAARWTRAARAEVRADHPILPLWEEAVTLAWHAECATTEGLLAGGTADPTTAPWRGALSARTAAPHRLQMLTAVMAAGLATDDPALAALEEVVTEVAALAAWLDDICDLDEDLAEGRWNTVTAAMHARAPLPLTDPAETRLAISLRLSFDHEVNMIMADGVAIRERLERALAQEAIDPVLLTPLVEDMITAYLAAP